MHPRTSRCLIQCRGPDGGVTTDSVRAIASLAGIARTGVARRVLAVTMDSLRYGRDEQGSRICSSQISRRRPGGGGKTRMLARGGVVARLQRVVFRVLDRIVGLAGGSPAGRRCCLSRPVQSVPDPPDPQARAAVIPTMIGDCCGRGVDQVWVDRVPRRGSDLRTPDGGPPGSAMRFTEPAAERQGCPSNLSAALRMRSFLWCG